MKLSLTIAVLLFLSNGSHAGGDHQDYLNGARDLLGMSLELNQLPKEQRLGGDSELIGFCELVQDFTFVEKIALSNSLNFFDGEDLNEIAKDEENRVMIEEYIQVTTSDIANFLLVAFDNFSSSPEDLEMEVSKVSDDGKYVYVDVESKKGDVDLVVKVKKDKSERVRLVNAYVRGVSIIALKTGQHSSVLSTRKTRRLIKSLEKSGQKYSQIELVNKAIVESLESEAQGLCPELEQ